MIGIYAQTFMIASRAEASSQAAGGGWRRIFSRKG